jgi:hypothetical protein
MEHMCLTFKAGGLCIAQIRLVQAVEEIHDCQHGEQAKIELPYQCTLCFRINVHTRDGDWYILLCGRGL